MASSKNVSDPPLTCPCKFLDQQNNESAETEKERGNIACGENNSRLLFNENFRFVHSSCFICNGFFGPCFDEPVCSTCHAFIYPTNAGPVFFSEKTDDGDSGNDEPTELLPDRLLHQYRAAAGPAAPLAGDQPLPAPPPAAPIPLAKRLEMLSTPREEGDTVSPGLVEHLPPEVLLTLFSYLDDLSLWSCAHVCKRWRHLLTSHIPDNNWEQYTAQRWPLFKPLYNVDNWFRVYGHLMTSCPCRTCLQQMSARAQPPGEENSWRRNRLKMELKSLRTDPPEGIEAIPLDQKCCHWQATITGPADSPYAGGLFYLYLHVPYSYPMSPPIVRFLTRIFHPNVSRHGDVGIDSIQHNWSLALTISKVLISIQSLLTDPFCQVCMEPEVGKLYKKDRRIYDKIARAWTWRYAMHDAMKPHWDPMPN